MEPWSLIGKTGDVGDDRSTLSFKPRQVLMIPVHQRSTALSRISVPRVSRIQGNWQSPTDI